MATAEEFRRTLKTLLDEATSRGESAVEVTAGHLHRRVGGYPGPHHSMPVCCTAMRAVAATYKHEVVQSPPSGKGASLTIRYRLSATATQTATATPHRPVAERKPPQNRPASGPLPMTSSESLTASGFMRMLVVGSCTSKKNVRDCPHLLTAAEVAQHEWRERLKSWALPAAQLYTGHQHVLMMNGVRKLRQNFGHGMCTVNIISAGYGVVSEQKLLVPYEVTFAGQRPHEILCKAEKLGIPNRLRDAVGTFPLVVFLLGKEYLYSTRPPMQSHSGQRFLFFASEDGRELVRAIGSTVVLAGKPEAQKYGASTLSLKGRMFELLAQGLVQHPDKWSALLNDDTDLTAIYLMESALESAR